MVLGLARKYRPRRFSEVVGQAHITDALRMAVRKGRVGQAYLFHGPRGTGKTTCARIMARVLNCEHPTAEGEPCLACPSCEAFEAGQSVNIYELDAASNSSVEDIRSLIDQVQYPPSSGKYKVYIIDEVHMLSQSAFNAFLKTLEEPPVHAVFILATTEKHRILPTILSRCQVFDFRRLAPERIVARLRQILEREGIEANPEALYAIAEQSDGIMRDALTITDRIIGGLEGPLTEEKVYHLLGVPPIRRFFELWEHIVAKDMPGALARVADFLHEGYDETMLFRGLRWHIRHLLMALRPETARLIQQAPSVVEKYRQQAEGLSALYLTNALNTTSAMEGRLARSVVPRLHLETAILKLIYLQDVVQPTVAEAPPPAAPASPPSKETPPSAPSEPAPEKPAPASASPENTGGQKPSPPDASSSPARETPPSSSDDHYWRTLWQGFVAELPRRLQFLKKTTPVFEPPGTVTIHVPPGYKTTVEKLLNQYNIRHARRQYQWTVVEEARLSPDRRMALLKEQDPAFGRLADGLGLFPGE